LLIKLFFVAVQQYISRHDGNTSVPEDHTDKTSKNQKRKLMLADDLDPNNIKKRHTSDQRDSKEDKSQQNLSNVTADSVVSDVSLALMDEEKPTDVSFELENMVEAVDDVTDQKENSAVETYNAVNVSDESDAVVISDEEMTEVGDAATDQKEDATVETSNAVNVRDESDTVVISDEYDEYETGPLEKAEAEENCEAIDGTAFETVDQCECDTVCSVTVERGRDAPLESISLSVCFSETGIDDVAAASFHRSEVGLYAAVIDEENTASMDDKCQELTKLDENSLQVEDKSHVDSEMCAASELVGYENVEKSMDEPSGFPSADDTAASPSEFPIDISASEKVEDVSEVRDKHDKSDAVNDDTNLSNEDDTNLSNEDGVLKEQDTSSVQSLKQADELSLEICNVDHGSLTHEATEKVVASQKLMPLTEDLDSSSQSAIVNCTESFPTAECNVEMEHGTLSIEAEAENGKLCAGFSSGDQRDVSLVTDSEPMSENVVEKHADDAEENLLPSSDDVTFTAAAAAAVVAHGSLTHKATEKVVACQKLMPLTEELDSSSQSTIVSCTESFPTAECDPEMERGILSIEAEAESAERCAGFLSGDQRDVLPVTKCKPMSECIDEKHGGDAGEKLLPTSDDVTPAAGAADGVDDDHGSLTHEVTKVVAGQSLMPVTEDLVSSSQSTIVSCTESFLTTECDVQMECGTLSIEAEAESAELCTGFSSVDQRDVPSVTNCEPVSGSIEEIRGAEENVLPTSNDVTAAAAAAADGDDDFEVELL